MYVLGNDQFTKKYLVHTILVGAKQNVLMRKLSCVWLASTCKQRYAALSVVRAHP